MRFPCTFPLDPRLTLLQIFAPNRVLDLVIDYPSISKPLRDGLFTSRAERAVMLGDHTLHPLGYLNSSCSLMSLSSWKDKFTLPVP